MVRIFSVFVAALFVSSVSGASDCSALRAELDAMRKAQAQIIESLIANHEKMSSVLVENSTGVRNSNEMLAVAHAFEQRSQAARKTAERLSEATEDLSARIGKCLKK